MGFLGVRLERSERWILNCIFLKVTVLIFMSGVALAADLDEDLIKAARKGDAKKVVALLRQGADVNAEERSFGWTPLKRAAAENKVDVVNLLIESGADIDAQNFSSYCCPHFPAGISAYGRTALYTAAFWGRREIAKALIAHGAAVDLATSSGLTALGVAFEYDKKEIVRMLLEAGADQFSLLLTNRWAKATKKNDTKSYQKIAEKYPTLILATEANRRIANSEYAFFQTARIGTKDAVKGFIKSHASSERIPIASAFLEYLKDVKLDNFGSARKFITSSPNNPFVQIVKAEFPLLYLQGLGASPYVESIEVVGARPGKSADRRKQASSELTKQLEKGGFERTGAQDETTTHLIEVVASGNISQAELFVQGLDRFTSQIDRSMAMTNLGSSDPVVNSIQRNARARAFEDAIDSLFRTSATPSPSQTERLHITIRDASNGDELYSDLERLSDSLRWPNFVTLLREPAPQVKLASSMVSLGQARFGEELYFLALNDDIDSVKAFLASAPEIDLDRGNARGLTPLMAAVNNGSVELASILIAEGADVDAKAASGHSAFLIAIAKQSVPMVNLLLNNGSDVDVSDDSGLTPLMYATDDIELVRLLLANDADVNLQANYGKTALTFASIEGHADTVQILLDNDADVNLQGNAGWTALTLASREGHADIVQILLDNDTDVNLQDDYGWTALNSASREGHADTVQILLNNDADVNHQANPREGDAVDPAVQILLKNAGVNLQANHGWTALTFASREGHADTVQILLNNDADVNLQDNDGRTALSIASENGNDAIVELLRTAGAVD